jgi:hypothetical protein
VTNNVLVKILQLKMSKQLDRWLCVVVLLIACSFAVTDSAKDLQIQLTATIISGGHSFNIRANNYVFDKSNFIIGKAQNFVITAEPGTIFTFYPGYGVAVHACKNLTLSGFGIDSNPAAFTQGVIKNIDTQQLLIEMDLNDGFPSPDPAVTPFFGNNPETKVIFWDATTKELLKDQPTFTPMQSFKQLGPKKYQIKVAWLPKIPKIGDFMTISPRIWSDVSRPVPTFYKGIYSVYNSVNVITRNISIYGGGDMGVLEWSGDGAHTYDNVKLIRRPNPPYPFRLLSSNLDAFHSFSLKQGSLIKNCEFAYMGDDFVNLHNRVFIVLNIISSAQGITGIVFVDPTDTLSDQPGEPMTSSAPFIASGETLSFYQINSRKPLGSGIVTSAPKKLTDPATLDAARKLFSTINEPPYNAGILGVSLNDIGVYQVEFTKPLVNPIKEIETLIQYDAHSSMGAVIRDSYFHDSYCNTMRLQASNTLIVNNTFEHAALGFNIVFDQAWLEGSLGLHNISVISNTLKSIGGCTTEKDCFNIDLDVKDVHIKGNKILP